MIKRITLLATALTLILTPVVSSYARPVRVVSGRILLREKAGVSSADADDLVAAHGGREIGRLHGLGVRVLHVSPERLEQVLESLSRNPNVEFAEPDVIREPQATMNDTFYSYEWHLSKIQATTAWDVTTGSANVTIAVLDSGVDTTHPDLLGQILPGWNFFDGTTDTSDVFGHGTAIAGVAVAISNNGTGVASVAPKCKIVPIRVTDAKGNGYDSTIAQALNWAADQGIRVATISFQVSNSSVVKSAAQYFQGKGGVVVVSAGNDGLTSTAADNPYVLTISATDRSDLLASWSSRGSNIDLAAPGVDILTTILGAQYAYQAGTSFSAPIVAGVAALVISTAPALTGVQVSDLLKKTADDLGAKGWDSQFGWGRINAKTAVTAAAPVSAPDTTAPQIVITSPGAGTKIAATATSVTVTSSASDNRAVTKVVLLADKVQVGTSTTSPFTIQWTFKTLKTGTHKLQTKAYDAAGNVGSSQVVSVTR